MKTLLNYCVRKIASLRSDNDGFVVMFTLSIFLLLFVFCSSIYAVGETIRQKVRLQNACDAAAYSAAVVQADGLSRMATVNQALQWTYVQMTNHQMDYITYRWLKLTAKRFYEDKENAEAFHSFIVTSFDIDEGLPGLIKSATDLAATRILGTLYPAWQFRCNRKHYMEGPGWWIGQGPPTENNFGQKDWKGKDEVSLNGHPYSESIRIETIDQVVKQLENAASNVVATGVVSPGSGTTPGGGSSGGGSSGGGSSGGGSSGGGSSGGGSSGGGSSGGGAFGGGSAGSGGNGAPVMNQDLIRLLGCIDGNDKSQWYDPDDPDNPIDPETSGWIRDPDNPNMWYDPEDPYGVDRDLESGMTLDQWRQNSRQKIEDHVNDKYQDRIDRETDPDKIAELEAARDAEIVSLESDLELIYGEKVIEQKYNLMIDALPEPDPNDMDAVSKYWSQVEDLEGQKNAEIEAFRASNGLTFADPSLSDGSTVLAASLTPPQPGNYEAQLKQMIETDKQMIQLLNETLPAINLSMHSSMETVAEFVLVQMLRDPRLPDDRALKKYQAYIYIPQGLDPYSATSQSLNVNEHLAIGNVSGGSSAVSIFDPVYNTEPDERLFLQFGSTRDPQRKLHQFFPVADSTVQGAGGLDQWFVRTGEEAGADGVRQRTEGALGFQRGYKDTNLNETGAGVFGHSVDRGNHIANLYLAGTTIFGESDDSSRSASGASGNVLFNFIKGFLDTLLGDISRKFCDIQPSCGNTHSDKPFIPMCTSSKENSSLFSEYEWSSAKWYCIAKGKPTLFTYCLIFGGFHSVNCDLGYSKKRFFGKFKLKGRGHYHVPKWFCGYRPRYMGDVGSFDLDPKDWIVQIGLLDLLPLTVEPIEGPREATGGYASGYPGDNPDEPEKDYVHGYMERPLDLDFLKPFEWLMGDGSTRREDYESCVCFIDGFLTNGCNIKTGGASGVINGHARIYGDDKDVWEPETYIGTQVKPWILNENFFSGAGTIVIGAAMKHENPFVQLFSMAQPNDISISGKSVLSAFDPPSYSGLKIGADRISAGNYMWTMSAARAAVRRVRRDGLFDQERMYQVAYDPTSDPENLHFKNQPYRYNYDPNNNNSSPSSGSSAWEPYDRESKHDPKCVLGGCVCSSVNTKQFQYVWNLCELDWDATLLPLRYAGCEAKLKGFDDSENYQSRIESIERMVNVPSESSPDHMRNFCGNGDNWEWVPDTSQPGTTAGNVNPMNPDNPNNTGWNPLDPSTDDSIKLDSLLPDGVNKLNLQELMRQNRIL